MHVRDANRRLVIEIFRQAVDDILAFPNPDISNKKKYRLGSKPQLALEAIEFVDKENDVFCIYCNLINMDPIYAEKKIYELIKKINRITPRHIKTMVTHTHKYKRMNQLHAL